MSTTSIDSTNATLAATTDWYAGPFGAGYQYVEVVNLDGASSVSYKVAAGTNDVTSLGADHWILPAAAGASRVHATPVSGEASVAFYVSVVSAGTPKVAVTAW